MTTFGITAIPKGSEILVYAMGQAYAGIDCAYCPGARSVTVGDRLVLKTGHDRRFPNGVGLFTLDNTLVGNIQHELNGWMQTCLRNLLLELRCLVWTCHVIKEDTVHGPYVSIIGWGLPQ